MTVDEVVLMLCEWLSVSSFFVLVCRWMEWVIQHFSVPPHQLVMITRWYALSLAHSLPPALPPSPSLPRPFFPLPSLNLSIPLSLSLLSLSFSPFFSLILPPSTICFMHTCRCVYVPSMTACVCVCVRSPPLLANKCFHIIVCYCSVWIFYDPWLMLIV